MTEKFVITGMTCAACAAHVERAAASVPGVHSASVNLMLGSPGVRQGRECGPRRHCGRRDGGGATAPCRRARPGGTCTRSRTRR